jgi:hypothetical protein
LEAQPGKQQAGGQIMKDAETVEEHKLVKIQRRWKSYKKLMRERERERERERAVEDSRQEPRNNGHNDK